MIGHPLGARRSIIINSLWGNANVLVRYGSSFVATALIAAYYEPGTFGIYQLMLSYLAIFEGMNLLNATHLRNHLVRNPGDEQAVASAWVLQSVVLWLLASLFVVFGYIFEEGDKEVWILLGIASVRLIFKVWEYGQIIADFRLKNALVQKAQMVMQGSFNIVRSCMAVGQVSLSVLSGASIVQGLVSAIYQITINKRIGFSFEFSPSKKKFFDFLKDGWLLALVVFLGAVQSRIVSILLAGRMNPADFGNYQLVVKLVEPGASLGMIVLSANYTVLAHTLNESKARFETRFRKMALLILIISILFSALCSLVPTDFMVRLFGSSYNAGLSMLGLGGWMIFSATALALSAQYDMLKRKYFSAMAKYGSVFVVYLLFFFATDFKMIISEALYLSIAVPILIVMFFMLIEFIKKSKSEQVRT